MNALNRAKVAHAIEDALGKILTILRYDENSENTVLCPLITLKALFDTNVELIAQVPTIHRSPFYDEVGYWSSKFIEWIGEWPETLTLKTIKQNPKFLSMTKKFIKLIYDSHLLAKRFDPPETSVWGIEYQTNHVMTTHAINKSQRQKVDEQVAQSAGDQFCKMTEIQRRMAKVLGDKFSHMYSAGPGGLDIPFVYMERTNTVECFSNKSEWGSQQKTALNKFKRQAADDEKIILPPIIIKLKEDDLDEDEPPVKMSRREDSEMLF